MIKKKNPLHILVYQTLAAMIVFQSFFAFTLVSPNKVDRAISSASATLSNTRTSYYAKVNGTHTASDNTIDIQTSSNPDNNTNHLFPNDTVSVGPNGNKTVASIVDSDTFVLTSGITVGASNGDPVYSTQSGTLTVTFTLGSSIPVNGYAKVTIPDPPTNGNDGAPDTTASLATNGFDLNQMDATNMSVSGGTGCTWSGTETVTAGSGNGHSYQQVTTTQCTGGTITMTVGDGTKGLVNPAKVTGASAGTADVYTITISTHDSSNVQIESQDVSVAVVEGVLVSASVEESLTFIVAGVTSDSSTVCGVTRTASSPDTTATAVPWGTVSSSYVAATHNTAQQLTVTTNAISGYKVYVEENDQMGRDGAECTGTAPSVGEYTFGSNTCIRDTVCDGTGCSHTTYRDWTTPGTYYGLGYSLEGTDATFAYNTSGASFNAKQFADIQGAESRSDANAHLMTNAGPVANSQAYVCFRISIPATQPAGYYYNKVKYTAVPTF